MKFASVERISPASPCASALVTTPPSGRLRLMRFTVPNIVFFGVIGFVADLFNFLGAQSEILTATFVFHATGFQLGILGACSSLCYAVPTLFTGVFSERVGRKPLVLAAVIGMGTSYSWGAVADGMREMYFVSALRSASTALLWPPVMAWMARVVPPRTLSRFLGSYNLCWASGIFFGFWGAGFMFQHYGRSSPFLVAASLAAALLLFVALANPAGGRGLIAPLLGNGESNEPDNHGLDPAQVRFFMKQGLLMVMAGSLASSAALYIFPKVGQGLLTEVQISLLNSFRMVGQMLAFYLMGRLSSWHYKRWPVWTIASALVFGLVVLSTGGNYAQFVAGILLIGFGFGGGYSMCAYYVLGLCETKGKGSGMMETTIGVGGLAGPLLSGTVASVSNPRSGILTGFIPVLLCAFAALRKRRV